MDTFRSVRTRVPSWVALSALGTIAAGCTGGESDDAGFVLSAEAVQLWTEAESTVPWSSTAFDVKAESREVVWAIDAQYRALLRFEPSAFDYRQMGMEDTPPEQIVFPVRLAVDPNLGVFVFDAETRQIDHFTPDGNPIHAFEPGFIPARMDIVHDPIGMQFAIVLTDRPDSLRRLAIIRTGVRGQEPDTLLYPGLRGPSALQSVEAVPGELALAAGHDGQWAWARTAPDTVFQIVRGSEVKKRVLRSEDTDPIGILVDGDREVLWVVSQLGEGELRYAAYDIRTSGTVGPETSYMGERTTSGFDPKDAGHGAVYGLLKLPGWRPRLAAYDMLVPEIR